MSAADPLALAAVALAAVALAAIGLLAALRRPASPSPAPARELPGSPEPPAVVNLVTEGFEVTRDAAAATLLDLGTRGHVQFERYADHTFCRLGARAEPGDRLNDYERLVLDRLRGLAHEGVAPADLLAFADSAQADRWFRRFARGVVAEAQRAGLCRPRWPWWEAAAVAAVGLAVWGLVAAVGEQAEPRALDDALRGGAVVGGLALLSVAGRMQRSLRQLPESAGLEAARRWLGVREHLSRTDSLREHPAAGVVVWGPALVYAAAMGVAAEALRDLSMGQDSDRHAWSRLTGRWRHVRVRYPRLRPAWGVHPVRAVLRGLAVAAVAIGAVAGVRALAEDPVELADIPLDLVTTADVLTVPVTAAAVAGAAYALVALSAGLLDLFATRLVEGVVLRRRERSFVPRRLRPLWDRWTGDEGGGSPQPGNRYYLAVDDGASDIVTAWSVDPRRFGLAQEGDDVRVRVTPLLGHVRSVEPRPD